MQQVDGAWILLAISPEELTTNGLPKIEDPVIVEFRDNTPIHLGIAKLIGSATNTNKDSYRASENGAAFIFSANFGS